MRVEVHQPVLAHERGGIGGLCVDPGERGEVLVSHPGGQGLRDVSRNSTRRAAESRRACRRSRTAAEPSQCATAPSRPPNFAKHPRSQPGREARASGRGARGPVLVARTQLVVMIRATSSRQAPNPAESRAVLVEARQPNRFAVDLTLPGSSSRSVTGTCLTKTRTPPASRSKTCRRSPAWPAARGHRALESQALTSARCEDAVA